MSEFHSKIKTIEWVDNFSRMVDQTVLPYEFKYVEIKTGDEMFKAIRTMIVRGAACHRCCRGSRGCFVRSGIGRTEPFA